MVKEVVFLHCSPRKKGNTRALANQAMAALADMGVASAEIDVPRLAMKHPGCIACFKCQQSEAFGCHVNDDLARAVATLPDYDAIVLATPVYWFGCTAQGKMFIDRMFSLIKFDENHVMRSPLAGKPVSVPPVPLCPRRSGGRSGPGGQGPGIRIASGRIAVAAAMGHGRRNGSQPQALDAVLARFAEETTMTTAPLRVTVVIPAYNAADTLADTLTALAAQTIGRDRFAVIVVDDGSTDGTAALAERLGATVIRQANAGPATARNAGAAAADCDVVVFTDADCAPAPEFLENILAPLADPSGWFSPRPPLSTTATRPHSPAICASSCAGLSGAFGPAATIPKKWCVTATLRRSSGSRPSWPAALAWDWPPCR